MAQQQQQDSPFGLHAVDDLYFSALFDDVDEPVPVPIISDDKYTNELQFQETLVASVITSQNASSSSSIPTPPPSFHCVASSSKAADVSLIVPKTEHSEFVIDDKEAVKASLIICEICAEPKRNDEMFRSQRCDHSFCSDCVTKQVATKIQESITVASCPGLNCRGVLELDACRPMLPKDLIERWDDALCEALLLSAPKFYCPFRDCSAMMLDEGEGGEEIRESECPFCHRLFCARCHVPWHPGVRCEEFQTLNEDEKGREDLLVRELANQKKWSRCPKCKFYVEKTVPL